MVSKKCYLAFLLVILLVLAGCKPTPKVATVTQKKDLTKNITQDDRVNSSALLAAVPKQYTSSFQARTTSVSIDANVVIPQLSYIPMAELAQTSITESEKAKWLQVLSQGKTLYYPRAEQDWSKSEIEQKIVQLKSGANSDLYLADPNAYAQSIKGQVKHLEQLYQTAPTAGRRRVIKDAAQVSSLEANVDLGKKQPAYIRMDGTDNIFYINSDNGTGAFGMISPVSAGTQGGTTISESAAQKKAENLVSKMGFTDFAVNGVGLIPFDEKGTDANIPTYEKLPKCYMFFFTRTIDGLQETYVDPTYTNMFIADNYADLWQPETIGVAVNDSGVVLLQYDNQPAKSKTVSKGVTIKPFTEIMNIFKQQIDLQGAWQDKEDPSVVSRSVTIRKIELGGMRIISKGKQGEYLYIPVWSFFGDVTSYHAKGQGDLGQQDAKGGTTSRELFQCVLTINALDGSVIDRARGY